MPPPRPRPGASKSLPRVLPFLIAGALAFATVPLTPVHRPWALVAAGVLAAAVAGLTLLGTYRPLPGPMSVALPAAYLAVAALLATAAGGDNPGYSSLVLLPMVWVAIAGGRLALAGMLVATGALNVGWVLAQSTETGAVWREAILRMVVAVLIAPAVQGLVRALHRRDAELAGHLDELRSSERRTRQIIDMAPEAFVEFDAAGTVSNWNVQAELTFGYSAPEAVGRPFTEIALAPEERPAFDEGRRRFLVHGSGWLAGHRVELTCRARSGRRFPVELSLTAVWNDATGWTFRVFLHDVTERRRAREELLEAEERFRLAFEDAPIGMALASPSGGFQRVNRALCDITGYSEDELLAADPRMVLEPDELEDGDDPRARLLAGAMRSYSLERRVVHAAGHPVWVRVSVSLMRDRDGGARHLIAQVEDISERKRFEGQLAHLADHDHLTGLLNRRAFHDELSRRLAHGRRYAHAGAVLVLDLDNFKDINDTLGHAAGDELISRVAGLLRVRLRETDVLGRLGGDEFAVVLPETGRAEAELVARDLLAAVRKETVAVEGDRPIRVSASVGVALYDQATTLSAEEALVNADIAMYDAKEAGRSRVVVSHQSEQRQAQMKARLTWGQRIREALAEERFTLYQQPIVALDTGEVVAHELLLRMRDESGDVIPPGAFLPVAERFGLVQDIDRWVVRTAIRTLEREQAAGRRPRFEINLSGASVTDPDLEHYIEVELAASRADPSGLVFELTETAAIVNVDRARRFATRLAELGCEFALDDFGAGFGSFYYLKHIPFDYLKIDGDFVRGLVDSREDQHVVRAIVEIASGMGKRTVAEFVGDDATMRMLGELGVDFAQGYHLGRPAPLADILSSAPTPPVATRAPAG